MTCPLCAFVGVQEPQLSEQEEVHAGCERLKVCGLSEGAYPRDPARAAQRKHPQEVRRALFTHSAAQECI